MTSELWKMWKAERDVLGSIAETAQMLEESLQEILGNKATEAKWKWPAEAKAVVERMRQYGKYHNSELRKELDQLLEWPDKESADPKGFYGKDPPFDRKEDWFENVMGFNKYETCYTFTDRWDKAEIMATFLVPNDLKSGDQCAIIWYFHGGGFCTGAGDHIPWYSKACLEHAKKHKAIVVAPDYPLGPEANYYQIFRAIRDFLRFYNEDGCFEEGEDHWTQWLAKNIGKEITINRDRLVVEGESAGAHAAVTALFLNAHVETGTKLAIDAVLLRYPMIAHYERYFPAGGQPIDYMGHKIRPQDAEKHARLIRGAVHRLDRFNILPTRTKGYAPQYMALAFLLSTTQSWNVSFRRDAWAGEDHSNMDCLERASQCVETVDHKYLPPIVMYHGHDDSNCPYGNTERFKELLTKHYPTRYIEDKTIFLEKVTQLNEKNGVEGNQSSEVGHGFDYALNTEREPFLKRAYERVDKFWPKPE
ncbi:Nn.00g012410.m01.CDS01 [Neocucurbitaria sp. VM-36]